MSFRPAGSVGKINLYKERSPSAEYGSGNFYKQTYNVIGNHQQINTPLDKSNSHLPFYINFALNPYDKNKNIYQIQEPNNLKIVVYHLNDKLYYQISRSDISKYPGQYAAFKAGLDSVNKIPYWKETINYARYGLIGQESIIGLPGGHHLKCSDPRDIILTIGQYISAYPKPDARNCRKATFFEVLKLPWGKTLNTVLDIKEGGSKKKRSIRDNSQFINPKDENIQKQILQECTSSIEEKAKYYNIVKENFSIFESSSLEMGNIMRQLWTNDPNFVSEVANKLVSSDIINSEDSLSFNNILRELSLNDYKFVTSVLNITNDQADNISLPELKKVLEGVDKEKSNAILNILQENKIIEYDSEISHMSPTYKKIRENIIIMGIISATVGTGLSIAGLLFAKSRKLKKHRKIATENEDVEMQIYKNFNDYEVRTSHQLEKNIKLINKSTLTTEDREDISIINEKLKLIQTECQENTGYVNKLDNYHLSTQNTLELHEQIRKELENLSLQTDLGRTVNIIKENHIFCVNKIRNNLDLEPQEIYEKLFLAENMFKYIIDEINIISKEKNALLANKNNYDNKIKLDEIIRANDTHLDDLVKCRSINDVVQARQKKDNTIEKINTIISSRGRY